MNTNGIQKKVFRLINMHPQKVFIRDKPLDCRIQVIDQGPRGHIVLHCDLQYVIIKEGVCSLI